MYAHGTSLLCDSGNRYRYIVILAGNHHKVGVFVHYDNYIRQEAVTLLGIEGSLGEALVVFDYITYASITKQLIAQLHLGT